ncbi:membrane integrity-associated transporter subunit PqiC [Psychromonas sp. KJ10-10]|uniref:PqiC family protein n=1 Tax=Psychromonas sp. KJ10-10 TaxID=3391823 RepID=UPI0039B3F1F1
MKKWLCIFTLFLTAYSSNIALKDSLFLLPVKQITPIASESAPILVLKTDLADYLNQVGLVYRVSETQVIQAQQNRWADKISDQISQHLINDLRTKQIVYWPVQLDSALALNNQTQLLVRFSKFNGEYTGTAELSGEWLLIDEQGKLINREYFQINKPLKTEGYEQLVFSLSEGLEELASTIARQF